MRGPFVAAVLIGALSSASPARAGLYSTEEHLLDLVFSHPSNYTRALQKLQQVVAVETEKDPKSPRGEVLARVQQLEQALQEGRLTAQERINLSAYYVRLNQPRKAIVLLEAVPLAQRDFMVSSNLATAYQLDGNLERAEAYLSDALQSWPKIVLETPNWRLTSWRLNWLKVVETYHLRLVRARLRERGGAPKGLDPIFPDLRFVGPSGHYEPRLLAANQWSKLPAGHTEIVKLLVLWMPHDARLRWLLAEIVNANDDPNGALEIMNELADTRKFGNPEFAAHHRILRHHKMIAERLTRLRPRFLEEKAKAALAPLNGLLPPGVDALLQATGTATAIDQIAGEKLPERDPTLDTAATASAPPAAAAPPAPAGWTPEWRQIAVSFVAGVVVATLLSLQLREMRKRKQSDVEAAPRS